MRNRIRALTMVEIVIAVALTGILVIPTAIVVGELLWAVMNSRNSSEALNLARYEMERLDAVDNFFTPDLDISGSPYVIPDYMSSGFTLIRTVSREAGNMNNPAYNKQGIKRIVVTITLSDTTQQFAELTTFRTKHVQFGQNP